MSTGAKLRAASKRTVRSLPSAGRQCFLDASNIVASHRVISHPFLVSFRRGLLSMPQVRRWATQQFFFSIALPSAFAALYARIPDHLWKEKYELIELLRIEVWGSRSPGAHSNSFMELCNFLDIDLASLTQTGAQPYTAQYLAARLEVCLNPTRHVGQGLAAIGLGNEILNLHIFQAYRDGIGRMVGFEKCPTEYFDAHLRDEDEDALVFLHLLERLVTTHEEQALAKQGLIELLDKRVVFFDALWNDLASLSQKD